MVFGRLREVLGRREEERRENTLMNLLNAQDPWTAWLHVAYHPLSTDDRQRRAIAQIRKTVAYQSDLPPDKLAELEAQLEQQDKDAPIIYGKVRRKV